MLCFSDGEELAVAERGSNHKADRAFRRGLVVRLANSCGDDGDVVMLRQLLVAFVQYRFVTGVLADCCLTVVGDQQARDTAEVIESVNMAEQPVLRLHIAANLGVGIPAAGQHGDKYVSRLYLSGNRIGDVEWVSCPIYLSRVTGLVRDAHGRFRNASPTAVLLAELRVHIWDPARSANLNAVFFPQKRECNAFLCKLPVDLRKIR